MYFLIEVLNNFDVRQAECEKYIKGGILTLKVHKIQIIKTRMSLSGCVCEFVKQSRGMDLSLHFMKSIFYGTLFRQLSKVRKLTRRADKMITSKRSVEPCRCKAVNQPLASLTTGCLFPLEPIRLNYGKGALDCGVCVGEVIPPDSCLLSDNSPSLWKSSLPAPPLPPPQQQLYADNNLDGNKTILFCPFLSIFLFGIARNEQSSRNAAISF